MLTAWEEPNWMVTAEHLRWDFTCEDSVRDVAFWNVRTKPQTWRDPIAGETIWFNGKTEFRSGTMGTLVLAGFPNQPRVYLTGLYTQKGDSGRAVRGEDNMPVGIVIQSWLPKGTEAHGLMAFVPTSIIREAFTECSSDVRF